MEKMKLNIYTSNFGNLKFGDFILFQEYTKGVHDGNRYHYSISKPIFAVYLGFFLADQAVGFNYVRWVNENRFTRSVEGYETNGQVENIECHIEWDDYVDILGHWESRPNWKELLQSYRKQNSDTTIVSTDINWEN